MALANLATTTDLTTNGVDFTAGALVNNLLAVASAIVRQAAGSPISEAESTVELVGYYGEQWLDLPGQPIQEITSVEIDGRTASPLLRGGRLYLCGGWSSDYAPSSVVVEMTHGLPVVPVDIVYLVCALVGAGLAAADDGLTTVDPRIVAELDGDYQVTFVRGSEAVATAMELPKGTRVALRSRFGGGAALVAFR